MLAKNKSGWTLMEYRNIAEDDIANFKNVTGAYAILQVAGQYVVGYNAWRKQWEFPAGRQNELCPFEHTDKDEMDKIMLWDMKEDIGYVDECDVKIVQMISSI